MQYNFGKLITQKEVRHAKERDHQHKKRIAEMKSDEKSPTIQ